MKSGGTDRMLLKLSSALLAALLFCVFAGGSRLRAGEAASEVLVSEGGGGGETPDTLSAKAGFSLKLLPVSGAALVLQAGVLWHPVNVDSPVSQPPVARSLVKLYLWLHRLIHYS